jgi:hypothetical protein
LFFSWAFRQIVRFTAGLLVMLSGIVIICVIGMSLDDYRRDWWLTKGFYTVGIAATILGAIITSRMVDAKLSHVVKAATDGKVSLDEPLEQSPEVNRAVWILGFYFILVLGLLNTAARVYDELVSHDWANLTVQGSIWLLTLGFVCVTYKTAWKAAFEIAIKRAERLRNSKEREPKGLE